MTLSRLFDMLSTRFHGVPISPWEDETAQEQFVLFWGHDVSHLRNIGSGEWPGLSPTKG